jgi:hypothetical protein
MNASAERERIYKEIELLPEERLPDIYRLLHNFRLRLNLNAPSKAPVMRYAGSWSNMSHDDFSALTDEISERRQQAFFGRREGEAGAR